MLEADCAIGAPQQRTEILSAADKVIAEKKTSITDE
jgi:hypothetical protein